MALTYTPIDDLGTHCPDFSLPGVDGKNYRLADFSNGKPLVIMFICNHCPYVKAIESRLITLGHDLKKLGVNLVGISANDAAEYPEDSFANMKSRSSEKNYSFPYLYDESQLVAKSFGAVCTPDFFVYNSDLKLSYRDRLDDSWKDETKVTTRELFTAVETLVAGKSDLGKQTPSMGCNIKWKQEE